MINAFLHPNYLRDAVQSVLGSSEGSDAVEILAVANASISGQEGWLARAGVRLVSSSEIRVGRRLLTGIDSAHGDVIAFLDDDDCFLPNKIPTLRELFSEPSVVCVRHPVQRVDARLQPILGAARRNPSVPGRSPTRGRRDFDLPLDRARIVFLHRQGVLNNLSSMAVRREALGDIADSFAQIDLAPDLALPAMLRGPGKFVVSGGPALSLYRIHRSVSRGSFEQHGVTPDSLEYLRRDIRNSEELASLPLQDHVSEFFRCHACSYDVLHWALTGEWVLTERNPVNTLATAVGGSFRQGSFLTGARVATTAVLGRVSRRLMFKAFDWQKQRD